MHKRTKFGGIIPAIITPLQDNGRIDESLLSKQIEYLCSKGVDGFFINGTTGEGGFLTTEEKIQVLKIAREVVGNHRFLCAACIQSSTELVLKEIRAFEPLQPDFIVAVTPYYYSVTQDTIFEHFRMISEHSPFPVIVYNIPQCTHNPIHLETILKLSKLDNIIGTKDSSGDFVSFVRGIASETTENFSWVQGNDYLDGPALLVGAKGIVTGLGNVWIEPYIEMWDVYKRGNYSEIMEKQKLINDLYRIIEAVPDKLIGAIKAAVTALGRASKWTKVPSMSVTDEEYSRVKNVMKEIGLL